MIAFRYTKTEGAEYIPHLDLLRHIDRTLRRAGIAVAYSEGFHKHPRIFLGNPLALGVRSVSEYGAIDSEFDGDCEREFNARSPAGIKCLACRRTEKNPNFAECIKACRYEAEGMPDFDTAEFMGRDSLEVTDLRGRTVDIMPRILGLSHENGRLCFTLRCGENNLRPDLFCSVICGIYGGEIKDIIKTDSFGDNIF